MLAPALQPQNARENPGTRACPWESRGSRGGGHSGVSGQRLTSDPVAKPVAPQFPGASQPPPLTSGFWAPSWRRRALPLLRGGAAFEAGLRGAGAGLRGAGAGLRGAGAGLGCCRDQDSFTSLLPQQTCPRWTVWAQFPLTWPGTLATLDPTNLLHPSNLQLPQNHLEQALLDKVSL